MDKRGFSGIVAAILLIFLVVIIGGIIYSYSAGFLEKQKASSESFPNQNLKAEINDVKIEPTGGLSTLPPLPSGEQIPEEKITIIIIRTDNEPINPRGARFTFSDKSGSSYTYDIFDPPLEAGFPKTYKITNSQLKITSFSDIEKVSLSFILEKGSQTKTLAEREI